MPRLLEPGPHVPVETVVDGARTVADVFRRRVEKTPDAPASYVKRGGISNLSIMLTLSSYRRPYQSQ